ncbi:MAG: hypothetical protein KDC38_19050 [Planctomycetes bacterium]|nr:hypothetical protein [Planctomycetota bacterium]
MTKSHRWMMTILLLGLGWAPAEVSAQVVSLPGATGAITTYVRAPDPSARFGTGPAGVVGLLQNGGFSSGLDGWTAGEMGGSALPGVVDVFLESARFTEGDSFLVTLEQTVSVPPGATALSFEVIVDPGFDLSSSFVPDAFELSLLDESLLPVVEPWGLGATSCFNLQEDGTANLGSSTSWDGATVTIDLSGVPVGTVMHLYFDLVGGDFDQGSSIRIDNVAIDAPSGLTPFLRGDLEGDLLVDAADALLLLDLLFAAGAIPVDCAGDPLLEVADANDNEFVTVADYLWLRSGATPAEPTVSCGFDPTNETQGFDAVDATHSAEFGAVTVDPPTGAIDRDVFIALDVVTPSAVVGATLIIDYAPSVLVPFDSLSGDGDPFVSALGSTAIVAEPGRLVVAVWTDVDGAAILPAGVSPQTIGTLRFHLADFATLPPLGLRAEETVAGFTYRATLVDAGLRDHAPFLIDTVGDFVRGDANDDSFINIADPIFTLNYLFNGGAMPGCDDAADSNDDGTINVADAVFSLTFLFQSGTAPPAPYPGCGPDGTPDDLLTCLESACPN